MHHFSVCVSDTGEAAVAHLRDFVPDEQRSAAEAGPVPDHSPPHRGAAYRPETGWWDPLLQLWDQPGPWWEDNLCGQLSAHFWLILKQKCMRLCDFHRTFNVPTYPPPSSRTHFWCLWCMAVNKRAIVEKSPLSWVVVHPSAPISSQQQARLKSFQT